MVILRSGYWTSTYDVLKGRFPLLEEVDFQLLYDCEEGQKEFGKSYFILIPAGCRPLTDHEIDPVRLRWLKGATYSFDAENARLMLETIQMTESGEHIADTLR